MPLFVVVNRVRAGRSLKSEVAEKIAVIERVPEKVVFTDPMYVILGHKTFVDIYYCPDSFVPVKEEGRLEEWAEKAASRSDAIIIDEKFYEATPNARFYQALKRLNKPIYFTTPRVRQLWEGS
jgi:hypothetical protein